MKDFTATTPPPLGSHPDIKLLRRMLDPKGLDEAYSFTHGFSEVDTGVKVLRTTDVCVCERERELIWTGILPRVSLALSLLG